jgi:signal transduction histidine kinase
MRFAPLPLVDSAPEAVSLLLVDDRPENLLALKAILDLPGYRLVTASSGPEALEKIAHEDFALLLLDVAMPGMSGFEVADQLKNEERTRTIPILFLTAVATGFEEVYRAYKIGAVDYLIKPLNVEAVRSKVAVFADLYRQRREIERRDERLRQAERREFALQLAELRIASDDRYRRLVEGIDHAFGWTTDKDARRLKFLSRRATESLGYPAEAFLREGFLLECVHPDDRETTRSAFAAAAEKGLDQIVNHRLVTASGAVRWYHTSVSRGLEPHTHQIVLHGLSTDVTELKAAEERQHRLARENARLYEHSERVAQALEELLRVVSHDLRNPLSSVLLGIKTASAALSSGEDIARAKNALEVVERNARIMVRLVDDLVERELVRTGKLSLTKARHEVQTLLRDALALVEQAARAKPVELRVEADAVRDAVLLCDRDRVLQVLANLLHNAIKFSPRDGTVLLAASPEPGAIRFEVVDQGPGIDPAQLPNVFERMWQAKQGAQRGLGLGLSIARALVHAHGGEIEVDSTPGKGSTFFFTLPLGEGEAVAPSEAAQVH